MALPLGRTPSTTIEGKNLMVVILIFLRAIQVGVLLHDRWRRYKRLKRMRQRRRDLDRIR